MILPAKTSKSEIEGKDPRPLFTTSQAIRPIRRTYVQLFGLHDVLTCIQPTACIRATLPRPGFTHRNTKSPIATRGPRTHDFLTREHAATKRLIEIFVSRHCRTHGTYPERADHCAPPRTRCKHYILMPVTISVVVSRWPYG